MTKPVKIDFKKTEKEYYYPKKIETITVPEMTYLTVSGEGGSRRRSLSKSYWVTLSYCLYDFHVL